MVMIIDFHTHVFPPQIKKNRDKYIAGDTTFASLYSEKEARIITADELVDSMDREGIALSVILNIGWTTHEMCVETNDYILESITRYPRRLVGFCSIQPNSHEATLMEIERCVKEGIKGIGELRPDLQTFSLTGETMTSVAEIMKGNGLILLIHTSEPVGHDYPGKGSVTPGTFYPFIAANPDLRIICAHWGAGLPFYALMPEVKDALHNVYYDTAASPFLYSPQIYKQVIQLVGSDKVLFGSDYPLSPQSRLLKEIESLNLSDEIQNQILAGNGRTLLRE